MKIFIYMTVLILSIAGGTTWLWHSDDTQLSTANDDLSLKENTRLNAPLSDNSEFPASVKQLQQALAHISLHEEIIKDFDTTSSLNSDEENQFNELKAKLTRLKAMQERHQF